MRFLLTALLFAVYTLTVYCHPTINEVTTPVNFEDDAVDSFQVIPYPGAETITLNGTMSSVYAQILEINPNYEEDWAATSPAPELERRADERPDVHCKVRENGLQQPLLDGVEYLRKNFKKRPGLPAKTCHTVSCSENTAIRWCNDQPTFRGLPSFNNIADGAMVIYKWCQINKIEVGGWLNHMDHWRVFVDRKEC